MHQSIQWICINVCRQKICKHISNLSPTIYGLFLWSKCSTTTEELRHCNYWYLLPWSRKEEQEQQFQWCCCWDWKQTACQSDLLKAYQSLAHSQVTSRNALTNISYNNHINIYCQNNNKANLASIGGERQYYMSRWPHSSSMTRAASCTLPRTSPFQWENVQRN